MTPITNDITDEEHKQPHHLIYKPSRFDEKRSPNCIFLPSQELLFKMMRACIGAESPKDLWIYDENISIPIDP